MRSILKVFQYTHYLNSLANAVIRKAVIVQPADFLKERDSVRSKRDRASKSNRGNHTDDFLF